jgi:hypothetical protein
MMLSQYEGIVLWDFEFRPDADHRQSPVCGTFLELRSGKRVELWGEFGARPPFPTTGDWLWASYHASAETHCHLALDWPIPELFLISRRSSGARPRTIQSMAARACPAPWARTACLGRTRSKSRQ